jgi:PAB-dependent poly(A)-specific ribonuclease subunit 2
MLQHKTNRQTYSHDEMKDLRCMSYTSKGASEILVAGLQDQMFTIDVEKGTIIKQVPSPNICLILR